MQMIEPVRLVRMCGITAWLMYNEQRSDTSIMRIQLRDGHPDAAHRCGPRDDCDLVIQ